MLLQAVSVIDFVCTSKSKFRYTCSSLVATFMFVEPVLFVNAILNNSEEKDKVVLNKTRFVNVGSCMNDCLSSSDANQYIVLVELSKYEALATAPRYDLMNACTAAPLKGNCSIGSKFQSWLSDVIGCELCLAIY